MNVIHLIVAELKAIAAKPHNIVVMLAVMCVPLLYAGMFLYGFWDAFGKTGNLPVAVVNQDDGAVISGKHLNAGEDLVKKLKKNNDFDWKFVSAKQAENGFKNNHYFMTVRIPASFSKNATTLTDNQLKPANLHYRINADYNFIASRMADAGVKQLKTRVSNEITKTYAKSMYTQLDKLTDGLDDAAKGSNKLAKGSKKEVNGLKTLKNGFKSLMNGTDQLQSGADKLADGASALSDGAAQLATGTSKVNNGAKQLASGNSQLSNGAGKLASGASELSNGSGRLHDGANTLSGGAKSLSNGANTLNQGINQYTGAVGNQLLPGASGLSGGLNQLNSGIQNQNLVRQVNQLNTGMQKFASSISELQQKLSSSIDPEAIGQSASKTIDAKQIGEQAVQNAENNGLKQKTVESADNIAKSVTQGITQSMATQQAKDQLANQLKNDPALTQIIKQIIGKSGGSISADDLSKLIDATAQSTASTLSGQINSNTDSLASQINPSLLDGTKQTISTTAAQTAQQVAPNVANQTASQIKSGIVSGLNQKDPSTGLTLNGAAQQLAKGTSQLAGKNGIPLIASSINQLSNGAGQLSNGLNKLNENSTALNGGASSLANGASTLSGGAADLANGASTLNGGASSLASGASTLSSGASTLANGASTLANGTHSLANGANTLSNGANTLSSGTNKLATALKSAGLGQQKLFNGINQLSNGAQQIYSGNTKLGTNLADAHGELAKTPTNNAHATKFAEPVTSIDSSNQSVDTFGSGFAPYFISLGLYVGALLLTIIYDLGKPAGLATSGWNIALSKFFITLLMSIGQALLIDVVVLKGLGLQVDHPLAFIGFSILTSMSYMALIQWLAGSFNNEGRFVAIVILIFQLVTSGGAYAIELIPKWLQSVSHILPMTYSVNGFRNIIDGNQHQMLVQNTSVLWLFVAIGLILSIVTFSIKFHVTHKRIKANNYEGTPIE
ncbi:YhgE/Pip domain-containing protein [Sporolactobacillus shoreicorticis]|uniref:YhgE/Pip family protein n=1 Tax=Sporolactobacillus shoreicorticis TaxID=1923877 RepID=A0ABW5S5R3_9BACL|nr:YhgE/Pip domain-containing protein [Sporolactobacillus shoreicorticis]MCO7126727.1 YhgE/Pip domain-containing protein [Sporolactobacillus shoreicorticis]